MDELLSLPAHNSRRFIVFARKFMEWNWKYFP